MFHFINKKCTDFEQNLQQLVFSFVYQVSNQIFFLSFSCEKRKDIIYSSSFSFTNTFNVSVEYQIAQTKIRCSAACNQLSSCRIFDYDSASKRCRLLKVIQQQDQSFHPFFILLFIIKCAKLVRYRIFDKVEQNNQSSSGSSL